MALKSSAIGFVKLHRHHAAATATRVEFPAPIGQTWRGDGGEPNLKAAIAYRLALCWNVLEGVPSSKLTEGWLRELCEAVIEGDLRLARELVDEVDIAIDRTGGRVHDCQQCLGLDDPNTPGQYDYDDGGSDGEAP